MMTCGMRRIRYGHDVSRISDPFATPRAPDRAAVAGTPISHRFDYRTPHALGSVRGRGGPPVAYARTAVVQL